MEESEMQIAPNKNASWLKAYSLAWKFVDLLYPPECIYCGKVGFRCCPECWEKRSLYGSEICQKCGRPLTQKAICDECEKKCQYRNCHQEDNRQLCVDRKRHKSGADHHQRSPDEHAKKHLIHGLNKLNIRRQPGC